MNFVYAPPPPPPSNDELDLPTHLPGEGPNTPEQQKSSEEVTNVHKFEETQPTNDSRASNGALKQKPVPIPGTNITLETEEDIAKWIADRKRNWPSKSNIDRKQQERAKRPAEEPTPETKAVPPAKRGRQVCRFFQQHGKCKFGAKCKNVHELAEQTAAYYRQTINGIDVRIPKLYSNRTKTPLFHSLVQQDHDQHENDRVLKFIQQLDQHGLIDHDAMKQ